ncbi:aminodeoxychorismate synthase component I [Henriciella sp.]|uniref:aminodeoxychorismate synthase component I n=1 Tax=Henriciella sp. TaxID=1968823 RepID=UPI00261E45E7|nr:aminodeoxychorismate synthase component I [Henriciella sp.]
MKVLIIDNYDSFTYNLAQLVAAASGSDPIVLYNDAVSESELRKLDFDAVVLSPGPGRPERRRDFGLCETILKEYRKPVLGVCLGHQGIAHFSGATVTHAPKPMHGRLSKIRHNGEHLFKGIMSPFNAVRYHSLVVNDLPDTIEVDAMTEDGLVMGMHHTELPLWGVQFHPESIASEYGDKIVENFLALAEDYLKTEQTDAAPDDQATPPTAVSSQLKPVFKELKTDLPSEVCFEILYGKSTDAYWLDSSSHAKQQGRYSFMGDDTGPHAERISYDVTSGSVEVTSKAGAQSFQESVFDYVERRMRSIVFLDHMDMPVPFKGGYVGYLGYELKADCGGRNAHKSRQADSKMIFADRFIAYDHQFKQAWMVCLVEPGKEEQARSWFASVEIRLRDSYLSSKPVRDTVMRDEATATDPWVMRHSRETYLDHINRSLEEITDGETYEVCLTNEWTKSYDKSPLGTYKMLRSMNPAPYSAFLRFDDLSVLSCSPERMVRISKEGLVNCKPIKGTIARGKTEAEDTALKETLYTSEKDRAENLMIVDLIRNDLNRVCRTGTVAVPKLCAIESFATVHQMVSTVTGELRQNESSVSCVRSLFPGGSMTGAPKIRTMEIIDELEAGPRGIYSGAIGFFSLDGSVDLNIVIRTIVLNGDHASLGAGGAIIALSDPVGEFDETMLKGELLRNALLTLAPADIEVVTHEEPADAK